MGCKDDPEIAKLLKTMATIAMNEAGYISSGHYPVDQFYHYGLALEFYTHFTVSFLMFILFYLFINYIQVTYSSIRRCGSASSIVDVCTRSNRRQ